MSTVTINTAFLHGIELVPAQVTASRCEALGFHLIGWPEGASAKEASLRIRSSLINSGLCTRDDLEHVEVTLSPASVSAGQSSSLDLAAAVAVLLMLGKVVLEHDPGMLLLAGELSLAGQLREIRGGLQFGEMEQHWLMLPRAAACRAAAVHPAAFGFADLKQVVDFLQGDPSIPCLAPAPLGRETSAVDFAEMCGPVAQYLARVLSIAAVGQHNALIVAPPGAGVTMAVRRLTSILPGMTREEMLDISRVYDAAGLLADRALLTERPFRAPHHTCSTVALAGGGPGLRPGEVSLAHNGVLFLDEVPEFRRNTLEHLMVVLDRGEVRLKNVAPFPAKAQLVAAMNPCGCGWNGYTHRTCGCTEDSVRRYRSHVPEPLRDACDIITRIPDAGPDWTLAGGERCESSAVLREKVVAAREQLAGRNRLALEDKPALEKQIAAAGIELGGVRYHAALRVVASIAALDAADQVSATHMAEALALQGLKFWS